MKIRIGFVSNSSATSFTIYGWTVEDLSSHMASLCPAYEGVNISLDYYGENGFLRNLEKAWKESGEENDWDIVESENSDGGQIFGLGESGDEIDHYLPQGQAWEDFEYPEPSLDKIKKFDEIAKKLKLPKPRMHKATFFA
jgi:hypothetical protein